MYKKLIVDHNIRSKHSELINEPIIVHVQEFNDKGVKEFVENMERAHETGQPVIPIVIDTYGGSVYGCLNMIEIMQKATLPIYTINTGKAMSAGAILFAMGEKRYMSKNATLMIHEASNFTFGKVEELKADVYETERLNKLIFKLITENCNKNENYFLDIIHKKSHAEWYMDAKEAKKHNLCTNIGIPQLQIEVKVNYSII